MKINLNPHFFVNKSTIQMKYVDSENWTTPVRMTQKRLDECYCDLSISHIRIKPDNSNLNLELEMK